MKRPWLAALAPYLWLGVFFAFPFLLVAKLSLSHTVLAMPPYAPQLDLSQGFAGARAFVVLAGRPFGQLAVSVDHHAIVLDRCLRRRSVTHMTQSASKRRVADRYRRT